MMQTGGSEMTRCSDHELLQPKAAPAGSTRYTYSDAEVDEMVSAIWAPAEDKAKAAAAIKAVVGARLSDAIRRHWAAQRQTERRAYLHEATGLGRDIGGEIYKPDASPTDFPCARCGRRPAAWIGGAGEALCARHQDDY